MFCVNQLGRNFNEVKSWENSLTEDFKFLKSSWRNFFSTFLKQKIPAGDLFGNKTWQLKQNKEEEEGAQCRTKNNSNELWHCGMERETLQSNCIKLSIFFFLQMLEKGSKSTLKGTSPTSNKNWMIIIGSIEQISLLWDGKIVFNATDFVAVVVLELNGEKKLN